VLLSLDYVAIKHLHSLKIKESIAQYSLKKIVWLLSDESPSKMVRKLINPRWIFIQEILGHMLGTKMQSTREYIFFLTV